jgi:hypothetical protein
MGRLQTAACLVSLLFAIPHEASHYLVARSQTSAAGFRVDLTDTDAYAVWEPLESRFWTAFAYLAPTVFGTVLAGLWAYRGVSLDGWRLVLAVGLALYTIPSPGDLRGALDQ